MVEMRLDRRIQQRVDASDIVQEVMIEANRRLRKYLDDPVMPFHLWLRQMAKDRIIDAHRRHRASGKRSVDREQGMVAPAAMMAGVSVGMALRSEKKAMRFGSSSSFCTLWPRRP